MELLSLSEHSQIPRSGRENPAVAEYKRRWYAKRMCDPEYRERRAAYMREYRAR